jgi:hypothetical protein
MIIDRIEAYDLRRRARLRRLLGDADNPSKTAAILALAELLTRIADEEA